MILTRVEIENFKQYSGEHIIDVPSQATIGVIGENGAGKTTLFEAIEWCLYSPRSFGQNDVRPRGTGGTTTVTVYLESTDGSQRYAVQRILRKSPTASIFQLDANGDAEKIAEGARQVTEYVASKLIGLSHSAFTATFFTRQKELHLFGDETPAKRREEIGRMLGLETIRTAQKDIAADRSLATAEAKALATHYQRASMGRDIPAELLVVDAQIHAARARHGEALTRRAASLVSRGDAEIALSKAQSRREQDVTFANQLQGLMQEQKNLGERQGQIEAELSSLAARELEKQSLLVLAEQAPKLQADLIQQEEIRQLYQQRLQAERIKHDAEQRHRDNNLTIRDMVNGLRPHPPIDGWIWTPDDNLNIVAGIDRLIAIVQSARPDDKRRAEQSLRAAHQLAHKLSEDESRLAQYQQLQAVLEREERTAVSLGDPREMLPKLDTRREMLLASRTRLEADLTTAEGERDRTARLVASVEQQQFGDACPTCGRPFSDDDASLVIATLRDRIVTLATAITDLRRSILETNGEITALGKEREAAFKEIEALDVIRKRLEKSVAVIATQQDTVNRSAADLALALSAIGRQIPPTSDELAEAARTTEESQLLDSNLKSLIAARQGALSVERQLQDASTQLKALGDVQFDQAAFSQLSQQVTKADRARTRLQLIDDLLRKRPALNADMDEVTTRQAATAAEVTAISTERTTLGYTAPELPSRQAELKAAQAAEQSALDDAHQAEIALQKATHRREVVVRDQEQLAKLAADADRRQADADTFDMMAKEFTEFERYAVGRKLPVLSEITSQLVSAVTEGKFDRVDFDQDFGLVVSDGGLSPDTYAISTFSGGERDAITLAARIALSHMIGRQATNPPGFLVLDEVFGSLDTDRRGRLMDLLGSITSSFPELRQIFIISHVDDVRTSPVLDELWRVEETETGSSRLTSLAAGAEIETL